MLDEVAFLVAQLALRVLVLSFHPLAEALAEPSQIKALVHAANSDCYISGVEFDTHTRPRHAVACKVLSMQLTVLDCFVNLLNVFEVLVTQL